MRPVGLVPVAFLFAAVLSGGYGDALAQGSTRFRIVFLQSQEAAPFRAVRQGFETGLRGHGFNAHFVTKNVGRKKKAPPLGFRPDLVVALGPSGTSAALDGFDDTPIVVALARDRTRIRQEPNATGVLFDYPVETQLRWMRKLLPNHHKVGVLFNPKENKDRVEPAAAMASRLGLDLLSHEIYEPKAIPKALRALAGNADLIWGISDQTVINKNTAKQFIVFSFENRIPLSGESTAWVKAGALFSLDRDYTDIGKQAALLAKRILDGERAGELPPEPPRRLLYSVNLKTARHMRLELSPDVIQNALYAFE